MAGPKQPDLEHMQNATLLAAYSHAHAQHATAVLELSLPPVPVRPVRAATGSVVPRTQLYAMVAMVVAGTCRHKSRHAPYVC
jgi:hypothetical protein